MDKWNKKTYARELKKGYWDLEPHFYHYCMLALFDLYRTYIKEKMCVDDIQSALYGKFVSEGKPIEKGFYEMFNATQKLIEVIIEDCTKERRTTK